MFQASLLEHPEAQALLSAAAVRGCRDRLTAFLRRYLLRFFRLEQRALVEVVVQGKLSKLQRKTSEPIAYLADRQRKPVQHFVGSDTWDDEAVMAELRRHVAERGAGGCGPKWVRAREAWVQTRDEDGRAGPRERLHLIRHKIRFNSLRSHVPWSNRTSCRRAAVPIACYSSFEASSPADDDPAQAPGCPRRLRLAPGPAMNPSSARRPVWNTLRILFLATVIPVALVGLVYAVALLVAWYRGEPGPTTAGAVAGAICALAVLLFVIVFHFRRETVVLPVEDRRAFLRRLGGQLEEMGYRVSLTGAGRLVGRPAFHSLLFGGLIEVRLGDERASLSGPKVYLEVLRRRLRVHNHLEQVPHALAAVRRRQGARLLRAVRLRLELPGELLPEVYHQLAGALTREGATLHCELCVHASSEKGLREPAFQAGVLDWLAEQQIPVELDKEPLVPDAVAS